MNVFHCGTCGLFDPDTQKCMINVPLYNMENPRDGYCSNHTFNPKQCDCCGSMMTPWSKLEFIPRGEKCVAVCPGCAEKYGMCETCTYARTQCNFEFMAQSAGIQPIVQKVVQQGPMQMITQVKNPQLVERACVECHCYKDGNCLKDTGGGCGNYLLNCIRD